MPSTILRTVKNTQVLKPKKSWVENAIPEEIHTDRVSKTAESGFQKYIYIS